MTSVIMIVGPLTVIIGCLLLGDVARQAQAALNAESGPSCASKPARRSN